MEKRFTHYLRKHHMSFSTCAFMYCFPKTEKPEYIKIAFAQLLHFVTTGAYRLKAMFFTVSFLMTTALGFAKGVIPHNFKAHAHYYSVLSTPVSGTTAFNSVSPGLKSSGVATGSGITATDIEGLNFRLTTGSSATMNIEVWDGAVSTGNGVAFYESTSSINPPITGIFMTANDGSHFDLVSMGINATNSSNGDATITITGLDAAGNPVSGATYSGTASASSLTIFNVNSIAAFKAIYGVRITSPDMNYVFVDNIGLANVSQSTLPVHWLGFTARQQGNAVVLNWRTAIEQGAESYAIQHSITAMDWKTVGIKATEGNSNTIQQYTFIHEDPAAGANYYRLVQRDVDGKEAYSKVVTVNVAVQKQFSVYPNPLMNGELNVKLKTAATVVVYNSAGHLLLKKELLPGTHQIGLNNFPKGIYCIKAGSEAASFVIQ